MMSDKRTILKVFAGIFFVFFIFILSAFSIDRPFELNSSWPFWLLALGAVGIFTSLLFRGDEKTADYELNGVFPVRRFFARSIDGFIVLAVIVTFSSLISSALAEFWLDYLNSSGYRGYLRTVAITVLVGYVCILIEIPVLKAFGTTPGKWLFGIYLRDEDGGRLSYGQVKGRSFSLFARGMAFCIDIAYYVAAALSYFRLKRQGKTRWDEDYGVRVHQKAWSAARAFACAYAVLIMFGVMAVFTMAGRT